MHTRLTHAVETIHTPFEIALHPTRVIDVIILAMVGLLETYDAIHALGGQHGIVLGLEGHNLYLDVRKILLGNAHRLGNVVGTSLYGVLSCDQKDVLEGTELLYGFVFILNLLHVQNHALHGVGNVKTAIDAGVGAGVGGIERNKHLNRFAKALQSIFLTQLSHGL